MYLYKYGNRACTRIGLLKLFRIYKLLFILWCSVGAHRYSVAGIDIRVNVNEER